MTNLQTVGTGVEPRAKGALAVVVIDMQEVFRASNGEWTVPGYASAAEQIQRLVDRFPDAVTWTKFVRDPEEHGSWGAYYDRWAECRKEPNSPIWAITMPTREPDTILALPTFSKWGPQLAEITAGRDHLIVCGVATDCCVLSTVLGAVDAGKTVTVVTDACAGATTEAHKQAIALMGMLSPMVRLATTDEMVQ